ncbi:MAG: RagB/SusD family nutrient uptake outer membrane protein [Longimicrobiales bacterium]
MRTHTLLIAGVLAFVTTGCQDLAITNPNNPDREVVVGSATDVEALVSTSFRRWFNMTQGLTPSTAITAAADEFSGGFTDYGTHEQGLEPRNAIDNGPVSANSPNRAPYSTIYSIIGGVNIALQAIDKYDLKILSSGTDVTQRAWAFGKFTQGLTHGWQAMLYDKGWAYSETMDTDTILFVEGSSQVQDLIVPYTVVRDTALAELAEALRIAESTPFTLPGSYQGDWVPGIEMSNQQFARLVHSFMARYMVYWARTPEDRAQVKWAEVIAHIDKGITQDFAPMGTPDILDSGYKNRAARQRTTTPGDFMRVDYQLIGPADQGSGYITWRAKPWSDRTPWVMSNVQDKRIISAPTASCTSNTANMLKVEGKYMGCHLSTVFSASRGTGQRSYYYFHRLGRGTTFETGPLLIMGLAEMDLLKAEGLIRLGRASEAVPLINKTRVANGELPPVTVDGVPGPFCTPRKFNGDCGSLWDALRYEKRIEGMGTDAAVAHWDARGWGALVINTPLQYPIPGNQLELMGLEEYTTGGGGYSSAAAPNPEKCPVALPRCP